MHQICYSRSTRSIFRYLEEFGQGSVEEKDGLVETMAESGELEYE